MTIAVFGKNRSRQHYFLLPFILQLERAKRKWPSRLGSAKCWNWGYYRLVAKISTCQQPRHMNNGALFPHPNTIHSPGFLWVFGFHFRFRCWCRVFPLAWHAFWKLIFALLQQVGCCLFEVFPPIIGDPRGERNVC